MREFEDALAQVRRLAQISAAKGEPPLRFENARDRPELQRRLAYARIPSLSSLEALQRPKAPDVTARLTRLRELIDRLELGPNR